MEKDKTSIAVQNTDTVIQFDYTAVDADTADKLRTISEQIISVKAKLIIEIAKQVKMAHDLLANHYKGLFGAWCESLGFSRDTGNNLVRVAEVFSKFDVAENFGNIKSLLYEASKPSAPKELVEQVKNGDITTHAEYIKLKKELERERDDNMNVQRNYSDLEKRHIELGRENMKLGARIRELESKPVDVAVDVDELNRRLAEKTVEMQNSLAQSIAEERRDFAEKLDRMESDQEKLEEENELLKKQLANRSRNEDVYVLIFTKSEIDALTRGKTPDDISARAKNAIKIGG